MNDKNIIFSILKDNININPDLFISLVQLAGNIIRFDETVNRTSYCEELFLSLFVSRTNLTFKVPVNDTVFKLVEFLHTNISNFLKADYFNCIVTSLNSKLSSGNNNEESVIKLYLSSFCNILYNTDSSIIDENNDLINELVNNLLINNKSTLIDIIFLKFVPALTKNVSDMYLEKVNQIIWKIIMNMLKDKSHIENQNHGLLILTGVCDTIFNIYTSKEYLEILFLHSDGDFSSLQLAMLSRNHMNRKRALFIFRNFLVCKLDGEIKLFCELIAWNNFLLILETLEETQFHLIEPTLKQISSIKKCLYECNKSVLETNVYWLIVLFKKMFMHSSSQIRKFAADNFLKQMTDHDWSICFKFVCTDFVDIFTNSSLYYSNCSDDFTVFEDLKNFFINFKCSNHEKAELLLHKLFERMYLLQWNGISLFLFTAALKYFYFPNTLTHQSTKYIIKLLGFNLFPIENSLKYGIRSNVLTLVLQTCKQTDFGPFNLIYILLCFNEDINQILHDNFFINKIKQIFEKSEKNSDWNIELCSNNIQLLLHNWFFDFEEFNIESICEILNLEKCRWFICVLYFNNIYQHVVHPDSINFDNIFEELTDLLCRLAKHVYLKNKTIQHILLLFTHLLQFTNDITSYKEFNLDLLYLFIASIKKIIDKSIINVMVFINRTLLNPKRENGISICCLALLEQLCKCEYIQDISFINLQHIIFKKNTMESYSMAVILNSLSIVASHRINIFETQSLVKIVDLIYQTNGNIDVDDMKLYESSYWNLLKLLFNLNIDLHFNMEHINENLINAIEHGHKEYFVHCLRCLKLLIRKLPEDKVLFFLKASWLQLENIQSHSSYWECLGVFSTCIFDHHKIFNLIITFSIQEFICKCLDTAFSKSEDKPRLLHFFLWPLLSSKCLLSITSNEFFLLDYIVQLLYTSSKADKATKLLKKVEKMALDENLIINKNLQHTDLKKLRYMSFAFIMQLDVDLHVNIAKQILKILKEHLEFNYKPQYYGDSRTHVARHQILLSFCCLEKFLLMECEDYFYYFVKKLDLIDQPSVRFLIEVLIFRLTFKNTLLTEKLFLLLKQDDGSKPSRLISFIFVLGQIASIQNVYSYIFEIVLAIAKWNGVSNSGVRAQAQAALVQIFYSMKLSDPKFHDDYFFKLVSFFQEKRSMHMSCWKLFDSFKYKINLEKDFNLEVLACHLPQKMHLLEDLVFDISVFLIITQHITLYNMTVLSTNPDLKFESQNLLIYNNASTLKDTFEIETTNLNTFQRKIIPKYDVLKIECESQNTFHKYNYITNDLKEYNEDVDAGLIVVATLVQLPSNLGGLCRSCEVFGVKKLVIKSLDCLKDHNFTSLSMTSHQWLNIKEVSECHLPEYLLRIKDCGYKVFGLEQTTQSQDLNYAVFPYNTAILLGNERTGIPANLLSLLDSFVEIKQKGIVRSLNVHVSASIFIAKYASLWP